MLKITCNNPVCGSSFFFNEEKNPSAKKVMCPKCKNVQTLQANIAPPQEEDFGWLKSDDGPHIASAPVMRQEIVQEQRQSNEFENFAPPKATKDAPVTPPRKPQRAAAGMREDEIGWLIIHDENTDSYTFDLRKGINRIGRNSDTTDQDVNIRIKTQDRFMSRHHCDIEVRWKSGKNVYEYVLSDKAYQRKKASANGTFVNAGRQLSPRDEILLNDGDTIQVGRTKLVLKLHSTVGNLQEAESWVREMDYFKTIIQ
jgi:pSer/pThr/pTyr-binding forkhead associated (FHA) protein